MFEFGDLRVNLLGKEDSPGALWSDTRPQYLHPIRPDVLHPQRVIELHTYCYEIQVFLSS